MRTKAVFSLLKMSTGWSTTTSKKARKKKGAPPNAKQANPESDKRRKPSKT